MSSMSSQPLGGVDPSVNRFLGDVNNQAHYDDPYQLDALQYSVAIGEDRRVVVDIPREHPFFSVFLRLGIAQHPERYGPHEGCLTSPQFYAELDKLEQWITSCTRFVRNEEELAILIALKNHLLTPIAHDNIGWAAVFVSREEKDTYIRRLLTFASKIKKLNPKFQKGGVGKIANNLITTCLLLLARNYFKAGKYSLAEGTYLKLIHKADDVGSRKVEEEDERTFLYECWINLSQIYAHAKAYEASIRCNQAAIDTFSAEHTIAYGDFKTELRVFTVIAQAYIRKDRKDEAIEMYERSAAATLRFKAGIERFKSEKEKLIRFVLPHFEWMIGDETYKMKIHVTRELVSKSIEALTYLESQLSSIHNMIGILRSQIKEIEMAQEKAATAQTCTEATNSNQSALKTVESTNKPVSKTAPPMSIAPYDSELASLIYGQVSVPTKGKKPKKKESSSCTEEASTTQTATSSDTRRAPTITEKVGFISRYIENSQTGAKYVFRLNEKHFETNVLDINLKKRVLKKFVEGEFVSGKGKQGFKFAAQEEKAAKKGFFLKLKLLGEDGIGDFRLYGRAAEGDPDEDGYKEIIFDGIDLNAHSNKSLIIIP